MRSLASGEPAWIELLDVTGRRVTKREVGTLGAGTHAVRLGNDARLAAGVYLVRLRQGALARVARTAIVP